MKRKLRLSVIYFSLFLGISGEAAVILEKLPAGALQPQIAVASDGSVHLVYLAGEPVSADIFYRRKAARENDWSTPMRVNSESGSAVATGTIRGAQLALGQSNRVHVGWNGSKKATPKPNDGGVPMLYSRLSDDGKNFEAQRNLMTRTHDLDGGGSIAADAKGNVFVIWHAAPVGKKGETNRAVFLARSSDQGRTFEKENIISPPNSGACGCCGLKALANERGHVFVFYRTASSMMQRDMRLIGSRDSGKNFKELFSHPWPVGACPMSTASIVQRGTVTWVGWETAGHVYAIGISDEEKSEAPIKIDSAKGSKHPRLISNGQGAVLTIWTEGTGWNKGGALGWQMFDQKGKTTEERGRADGVAVWSFAAAYAQPDGNFVVLY